MLGAPMLGEDLSSLVFSNDLDRFKDFMSQVWQGPLDVPHKRSISSINVCGVRLDVEIGAARVADEDIAPAKAAWTAGRFWHWIRTNERRVSKCRWTGPASNSPGCPARASTVNS